jgi:hypothetical protein
MLVIIDDLGQRVHGASMPNAVMIAIHRLIEP